VRVAAAAAGWCRVLLVRWCGGGKEAIEPDHCKGPAFCAQNAPKGVFCGVRLRHPVPKAPQSTNSSDCLQEPPSALCVPPSHSESSVVCVRVWLRLECASVKFRAIRGLRRVRLGHPIPSPRMALSRANVPTLEQGRGGRREFVWRARALIWSFPSPVPTPAQSVAGRSAGRPGSACRALLPPKRERKDAQDDGLWAPPTPPATPLQPATAALRRTCAVTRTCEPRGSRPPHQLRLRAFRGPLSRLDQPRASHVGQ
jgi:hypothetical protein